MLAELLVSLPFVVFPCAALWWVTRRLPAGWKGVGLGFAAMIVIPVFAFGGWCIALSMVTNAVYVCLVCGRTEKQEQILGVPCSHELIVDGHDYTQRFGVDPSGHAHEWHLESCLRYATGKVACTEECAQGWFRMLPKLRDRAAAERLFRNARSLPRDERRALMCSFTRFVAFRSETPNGLDAAFESWRARPPR